MCRLAGWFADRPMSLRDVLGDEAVARFVDLSRFHGHGWGIAWRAADGTLRELRSTRAARDDETFGQVVDQAATSAVVHLRWATPGFGLTLRDTHPFVEDGWAFIHNGAISPSDRVKGLLAAGSRRSAGGSTDSENLFLAIRDELAAGRPVDTSGAEAEATVGHLARAMEVISERGVDVGLTASSLNALLLGPRGLYAVNWADVTKVPPIMREAAKDDPASPPYYDLLHHRGDGVDVIASSGFVSAADGWRALPEVSVTGVDAAGWCGTSPIRPRRALCPTELTEAAAG